MPVKNQTKGGLIAPARKFPKGKVAPGLGKPKVTVKKPKVTASTNMPNKQKPVKTPMKKADRQARANAGKAMHRKGVSGPVKYKTGGGNKKK